MLLMLSDSTVTKIICRLGANEKKKFTQKPLVKRQYN